MLLCVILAVCSATIHWGSFNSQPTAHNIADLGKSLSDIPGWQQQISTALNPDVAEVLELDDYLNSQYSNKIDNVSLYIGQYYSAEKIGAVHHPMVCMPGQGLKVSQHSNEEITVTKNSQSFHISYSLIISEINNQKNLVIYWFQIGDSAYSNTFPQKIASFWNTLTGQEQKNAYVRITTSLNGKNMKDAKSLIFGFIDNFYPIYIDYIKQGDSNTT